MNEEYEHLLDSEPGTPPLPAQQDPSVRPVTPRVVPETNTEPDVPKTQNDAKKSLAAPAVRRLAMEYNVRVKLDISFGIRDSLVVLFRFLIHFVNKGAVSSFTDN